MTTTTANKKLTKAHIVVILLFIGALFAYSYYEVVLKTKLNGATLIDNPTAKAINVKIDGQAYNVPANSYVGVELELGHHKIDCEAYHIAGQDLHLDPTEYGVINSTKSKYVIYNIIYTKKDLRDQFKPYQVEGKEVYSL